MNPYPPNMDMSRVDIPNTDDLCDKCEKGFFKPVHWWKFNKKQEATGELECDDCGWTINQKEFVDYSRLYGVNISYEQVS